MSLRRAPLAVWVLLSVPVIYPNWIASAEDAKPAPEEAQAQSQSAGHGGETSASTHAAMPVPPVPTGSVDSVCLVDQSALEDLKKRKGEWEAKMKQLADRETELLARERALNEELKKLTEVRDQIKQSDALQTAQAQEKVAKLVETVETMSPKAAAQLFNTLDDHLAVAAMRQMATPKLAKIMNLLPAERATLLSENMAGVARARGVASASKKNGAAEATKSKKGGE